ncbi:hypothetical protein FRC01_001922 [Tulasnella sp. 417]|nr:hypothetical protein FRC01_001922 [Tulasnella sp. 417]
MFGVAGQKGVPSKEGARITGPVGSETTVASLISLNSGRGSGFQPASRIPECDLPSELAGTLIKIRETVGSSARKIDYENDSGEHAEVSKGFLNQPDGSRIEVAIKSLKRAKGFDEKSFRPRVSREVSIWAAAKHPNILEFIGYKVIDGAYCLTSPWCQRGSLARYITESQRINSRERLKMLGDAARGLAHLHSLMPAIIHGNIKPENVIVKDNLQAALCGFGVSRIFAGIGEASGLTTTDDMSRGTAGYQAKELLQDGAPSVSLPGDVYAFGGLILATMSGKSPFWKKRSAAARIAAVCTDQIPSPRDHLDLLADNPLWELLGACWSVDPTARPTTETVLRKLENVIPAPPMARDITKRTTITRGLESGDEDEIPMPPMATGITRGAAMMPDSVVNIRPIPPQTIPRPPRDNEKFIHNVPPPISGAIIKQREPIARGAYGDVYRGLWGMQQVVIKCLKLRDQTQRKFLETRIKREATIWTMVTHPNVLPFNGYQIFDEVPMLVSPWCVNGDLATYLGNNPSLTRTEKLKLVCDAARGLVYLHSLDPPVFHGDIKPQNVIVLDNLQAALCDFGISKLILDEGEHSGFTTSDACSGTAGYQPQEILNEGPPTTAADVYAFGGLTLATLSGKPPFWRMKKETAKIFAIFLKLTAQPEDHPLLPQADPIWALLQECWSAEPSHRPAMPKVLEQLEAKMTAQ